MLDTCSVYRVARLDCRIAAEGLPLGGPVTCEGATIAAPLLPISASMQQHVPYELTCSRQQHARSPADRPSARIPRPVESIAV
jgi:hypothetical protein